MSLIRIASVAPLDGFRLRLTLTNGDVIERDVLHLMTGRVFEELRADPNEFRTVRVQGGTVVWRNGADLCPDTLIWGGLPPVSAAHPGDVVRISPPRGQVTSSDA